MREILFRAKRVDNGEWVEGFLCLKNIIKYTRKCFDWRGDYVCDSVEEHKVNSETVGQFTGLTDKNGKKIFEGDIVKHCFMENCLITYEYGAFCFREVGQDYGIAFYDHEEGEYPESFEVIGNITDNPELLDSIK